MIKSRDIILQAKRIVLTKISSLRHIIKVPKGHFTVYVGEDEEETKRFVVVKTSFVPSSENEFGTDHSRKYLTIPCAEDVFIEVTSRLN
ncbi:unnamed protein product [Brassica oleracea]|uniref:Uncharacterized protein n=1 Tax=Brassica carinata TaxID=52824 RepID=A0A8X7NYA7_BRACI|nr:hypothetical protein Bca52824_090404 [Brassica carinata]